MSHPFLILLAFAFVFDCRYLCLQGNYHGVHLYNLADQMVHFGDLWVFVVVDRRYRWLLLSWAGLKTTLPQLDPFNYRPLPHFFAGELVTTNKVVVRLVTFRTCIMVDLFQVFDTFLWWQRLHMNYSLGLLPTNPDQSFQTISKKVRKRFLKFTLHPPQSLHRQCQHMTLYLRLHRKLMLQVMQIILEDTISFLVLQRNINFSKVIPLFNLNIGRVAIPHHDIGCLAWVEKEHGGYRVSFLEYCCFGHND